MLNDVDERRLRHKQQNSVCFASFQGQLVLTVTGNYYAAYSRNLVDKGRRADWTFRDAMFPILAAAVEHLRAFSTCQSQSGWPTKRCTLDLRT